MKQIIAFLILSAVSFLGISAEPEDQARKIEQLLMTPCCWGSTVAEHSSEEALEIKSEIRTMLREGKSENEILAYYESKFGERILSRPKKSGFNLLVWVLPSIGLLLGGIFIMVFLKRDRVKNVAAESPPVPTTAADEKYRKQLEQELYG